MKYCIQAWCDDAPYWWTIPDYGTFWFRWTARLVLASLRRQPDLTFAKFRIVEKSTQRAVRPTEEPAK